MKRILLPGIVAGIAMLITSMIFGWVISALIPSLAGEYANTALFRPWSDPLMSLFFLYPFVLGIGLAWVWDRLKGVLPGPTAVARGLLLARSFWLVSSIPGILMSYASFPITLAMALSWLASSLLQLLAAGPVFALLNKPAVISTQ